jgi:hypothetical protein
MPNELAAGRELDALVAEKVMGWTSVRTGKKYDASDFDDLYGQPPGGADWRYPVPRYSEDIAAAWGVVQKIGLFVGPFVAGEWWASLSIDDYLNSRCSKGATGPLAICRAALSAMAHKA